MKRNRIVRVFAGVGLIVLVAQGAFGADKEKPSAEVQARVTQVIKRNFPDALIKEMGKESEDGLSFVSVDFTSKGTSMEADVMEDGTLVGTEAAARLRDFPKAAAKALKKATKGMTVKETEIATTYAKADPTDKSGLKAITLPEPVVTYTFPAGLSDVVAIAAGNQFAMALKKDGTIAVWGEPMGSAPTNIPPNLNNVVAIAAGWYHGLVLQADGTVVAGGNDTFGGADVPPGLNNAVGIAAGFAFSLALKSDGSIVAWGSTGFNRTTVPPGLTNVIAVHI